MEPQTTPAMSMERAFELAKMLGQVESCQDLAAIKEVTMELLKLNMNQRCYYEQLLSKHWGF